MTCRLKQTKLLTRGMNQRIVFVISKFNNVRSMQYKTNNLIKLLTLRSRNQNTSWGHLKKIKEIKEKLREIKNKNSLFNYLCPVTFFF